MLTTSIQAEGDATFMGLDMKHDRGVLQPGFLALSENKRLRRGVAETRPAIGQPAAFNGAVGAPIRGAKIYSNPNGDELMTVAESGKSYVTLMEASPRSTKTSKGFTKPSVTRIVLPAVGSKGEYEMIPTTGRAEFVQAFDQLILLRTGQERILSWDGKQGSYFIEITKPDPDNDAVNLIPNEITDGEVFQDRVLYYRSGLSDEITMSLTEQYQIYDPIFGVIRINSGEADKIIRVFPFGIESVLVLKNHSIHLLSTFTGQPQDATRQTVNNGIGCAAKLCVVQVGADVFFLSEPGGIYRLSEVIQSRVQTEPVPVSDRIQPVIDRINWGAASQSCADVHGDYAFFGVPLDDATAPNALLVYNTVTDQWESVDTYGAPGIEFQSLLTTFVNDKRQLLGIDSTRMKIYQIDAGDETKDEIADSLVAINDAIETRGYGAQMGVLRQGYDQVYGGPLSWKRFLKFSVATQTAYPQGAITGITDGYDEEKTLATITGVPGRSYLHGVTTATDAVRTRARDEDYTQLPEGLGFSGQSFDTLEVTGDPIDSLPRQDSPSEIKQQSLRRGAVRMSGRWLSLRIANTHGKCDVLAVSVQGVASRNEAMVAA